MGEELGLDELEIGLDYDDFIESLDRNFPGQDLTPVIFFETSRGCWWGERCALHLLRAQRARRWSTARCSPTARSASSRA